MFAFPPFLQVDMAAADIPKATSQVVGLTDCNEEDVMQVRTVRWW